MLEKEPVNPSDQFMSDFKFLPGYADFLLRQRLREFSVRLLALSRHLKVPLLRYLEGIPEEQLILLSMEGNRELLSAIAERRHIAYIEKSLRTWKENQLPVIQGDDIVIEDISKVNFVRRQGFREFLFQYTATVSDYVGIMEELDCFILAQEEVSYKTLFEMKESKIREHHHFIDKINNASPGVIYVYDPVNQRQIYANHKGEEVLGYNKEDLAQMQGDVVARIIHPDDRDALQRHIQRMLSAEDSELHTVEYRVLNKIGRYVWQRAYETVFKRTRQGAPSEIIGIAIDVSQEKEAILSLEQREQQLREAQEIAGMGSFDWDLQGAESIYSSQLLQIFELEQHSNLPDFLQFVHPADRDSVKQAIADALTGKSDYECEYRYRKDGPEKVIWSRGKVIFENGRPIKMKGTVMDVTQRHDMIKRLARSEELHKQAQALTHLGNWSWSLIDDRVEWSDEMYRIFGLEPQSEQMNFDRFEAFIHPDDRKRLREALHVAITTMHADDYLMRVIPRGGSVKYIEGKTEVLLDEQGKPYKIAGTCQDITEHYLLNERLKENEEASRQLINSAPEAIVVIDEQDNIELWNPQAEVIFGWTESEVRGRTLIDTLIPDQGQYQLFKAASQNASEPEMPVQGNALEVEARKKDGAPIYIALNISRSHRAGKPVFIAFIRDVTEERAIALKLEEQRNQLALQNRALERSNQELTAFNYISSHDLKEPVRKIKIFSNLVVSSPDPLSQQQHNSIDRIISAADHMERLIEALIVFSRTNTGERKFELVELNAILADIKLLMKDRIDELGAVITSDPLPELWAVHFQIQQLFENIIGNALKYSKPNNQPRINISAERIMGADIENLGADPRTMYHHISIADNGIGFEQQYATKIFEVFQRLHGKDSYSGTGIGLAICKKIVQHHDGFITARSSPGQGSTFDIYLPISTN